MISSHALTCRRKHKFPRVGLETRAETMRKIIGFYVYCLAAFPLISMIALVAITSFSANPRPIAIARTIVEIIVAYIVINGYRIGYYHRLRIGSAFYGFYAFGTILLAAILGNLLFYGIAVFEVLGCYFLGFSAVARSLRVELGSNSNNRNAAKEFEQSEDYTEYNGHSIRKSRSYYWIGEVRFSDIKKAEAYIENEL